MRVRIRPMGWGQVVMDGVMRVVNFVVPGLMVRELECRECGMVVEEGNAAGHWEYFHGE